MRIAYAEQFKTASVVIEEGDNNAAEIIQEAEQNDAVYDADDHYLVVRFPGRPDETYTEEALRRTFVAAGSF